MHSCLMLDTREEAENFPRGDVRLAACQACGMITNLDFDPRWSAYSPDYEDQQAFSPTFNSFAGRLAKDLVARHALTNQTVIDIGCSKGDFLALMCDAGCAVGVGIDPSVVEGRVAPPQNGRLELIKSKYEDKHTTLPAELISNRHTLEHILHVEDMLRRMHRHAVASNDAIVFVEVPCMARVLRDCAFEDIYYEHCSYFTPGTLARTLRHVGFGVSRLWLDFGNQYLLAEAVTDPDQGRNFDIEESTVEVGKMVEAFRAQVPPALNNWDAQLADVTKSGGKVAIWGSGSKCIAFWHAVHGSDCVSAIVDINPNRWGKYLPSLPMSVSPPDSLKDDPPDTVVIMNAIYREEIEAHLLSLGLQPQLLTL